jgi:hypothetical protein
MGIGSNSNANTVYFDAETGQYYTNPAYGDERNYLGNPIVSQQNPSKMSMVSSNVDRAKAAYENTLAGLATNPGQNLSVLFPNLSNPTATQGMMGAGRFLGQQQQAMPQQMYGYTPQQSNLLNTLMNPGMNMTSGANQGMGSMATPQFSFNTTA